MTKETSFKVGDRVRVYGANTQDGTLCGEVVDFNHAKWLMVRPDLKVDVTHSYHSKQCRRLVRKPRRTVWIDQVCLGGLATADGMQGSVYVSLKEMPRAVQFREVRPRDKTLLSGDGEK